MKRAISVTIGDDNLLWLKGQAGASQRQRQRGHRPPDPGGTGGRPDRCGRDPVRRRNDRSAGRRSGPRRGRTPTSGDSSIDRSAPDAGTRASPRAKGQTAWLSPRPPSQTPTRFCFTRPATPASGKAAAHFDRAEERRAIVYVPAAVMWEVALLARGARDQPSPAAAGLLRRPVHQSRLSAQRPDGRPDLRCRRPPLQPRSVRRAHLRRRARPPAPADHARHRYRRVGSGRVIW